MLVAYTASTPSLNSPSAGYIFQWMARTVSRYREEQEHQDVLECQEAYAIVVSASDAGGILYNAV